jgi:hypothetical protein
MATCSGCCDSTGACQSPITDAHCGTRGGQCATCGSGLTCVNGLCSAPVVDDTCQPCLTTSDCDGGDSCVQYAGSDFCGHPCGPTVPCATGDCCLATVTSVGTQLSVCVPTNGTCGTSGCGTCPSGTTCDQINGACTGGAGGGAGGGGGGPVTYDGGVTNTGGAVSRLYFAVVGDTRPQYPDDDSNYPTAIITQIYQDIAALQPPPQFVITTGDYMFAKTTGSHGATQLDFYQGARANFPNPQFPVMGNHECNGFSDGNCTSPTANMSAFISKLLAPIGQNKVYYSIDINDTAGQWTSKFIFVACNAWDSTQQSWLATELARPTTFTFVVRHMPIGSNGPCNADMDPMLASATYTALLVGHSHTVYMSLAQKELVEGMGGAPATSNINYGYALVVQNPDGGFSITQHDYQTNAVNGSWQIP